MSPTLLCLIVGESNCIFWNLSPPKAFYYDPPKLRNFRESPTPPPPSFNYHPLILWNFSCIPFLVFLYSCFLYLKKLSNTVNHSNKLILTYFFRAVFINLYFKTKHSNETFHLGFYSLSNVFSYKKHISSESKPTLTALGSIHSSIHSGHYTFRPEVCN